jgi:hypothetical protein
MKMLLNISTFVCVHSTQNELSVTNTQHRYVNYTKRYIELTAVVSPNISAFIKVTSTELISTLAHLYRNHPDLPTAANLFKILRI